MSRITWGVDGYGQRHYLCDYCELLFGCVDPDTIKHNCDTSLPRYHNRGVHSEDIERESRYKEKIKKAALNGINFHCDD